MRKALLGSLAAAAGSLAIALVCFRLFHSNATIAALFLLLGVVLAGAYASYAEAIAASLSATLCLDYFFIPPVGQITIADPQGWIALGVFLAVSLVATNLSARLRRQRDELATRQSDAEKLHALNRAILLSEGGTHEVQRVLVNKCMELFGLEEAALFESATGEVHRSSQYGLIAETELRKAARYTIAIGLAQAQAQQVASRAEAVRRSEELKSVMIDALAHELKTPLTAIEAAADMLQAGRVSQEQRDDLIDVVQQEAQRLRRLMGEAIHLARIEAKRLKLERQAIKVDSLIQRALDSLGQRAGSHPIRLETAGAMPLVFADPELIADLIKQLLDNALKYSPPGRPISVSAEELNGLVSIAVRDEGQGLTELEQSRIFEKFYRARRDHAGVQGTGMGLAIAREIAEAHGGAVRVESQLGQGSLFTVTLPAAPLAVLADASSRP
jgi:two-component system sensor histidine kinase KdpD